MTTAYFICYSTERLPMRSVQIFTDPSDKSEHVGKIRRRWECVKDDGSRIYKYDIRNMDEDYANLYDLDETVSLVEER